MASRRIDVLIFADFQLLDAAGPIAAFEIAGRLAPGAYDLRVVSTAPGWVKSSSGAALMAAPQDEAPLDTLLVSGGDGTRPERLDPAVIAAVSAAAWSRPISSSWMP